MGCPEYWPELGRRTASDESYGAADLLGARNIGIIEMGGLGSIMRTTAVTRAIRQHNADARIQWYTHRRGSALLRYVPSVEAVNIEDTPYGTYHQTVENSDVILNFELTNAAKPIVAGAKKVGGFALNSQDKFRGVMPDAEYMQRMQIDDKLRAANRLTMQEVLLKTVGFAGEEAAYDIQIKTENTQRAESILHNAISGEPAQGYIGLNIGTSQKGRVRRWPAESHANLADRLSKKYPDRAVIVLNGPDDDEPRTRVMAALEAGNPNVGILPNDIEIGDFIALVGKLGLLVTSDTFGFHAAKSQGVSVAALTGPMPSQELEITENDVVIKSKICVSPCYHRCIQSVPERCMDSISVEEVFRKVVQQLAYI